MTGSKYTTLENNSTTHVVAPTTTSQVTLDKVNTASQADRRKLFNQADRRKRRDTARDVWAAYRAIVEACGFFPLEGRTAEAISLCHYEYAGEDYDERRNIKLAIISAKLRCSGKGDGINTASNRVSQLFTEAQPRTGYQLLTRYKALEDGRSHEYVDHIMPVAEMVAEYWAIERTAISKGKGAQKQDRIAEALQRLALQALVHLPKCEAQLVDKETGEVYAYLSDAEARTHAAKNPNFEAQPKTARPKRRFNQQDEDRLNQKIRNLIADTLDEYMERNGLPDANKFSVVAEHAALAEIKAWRKTAPIRQLGTEIEELNHVPKNVTICQPQPLELDADAREILPKNGNTFSLSINETNSIDFSSFDTADSGASAEARAHGYTGPGAYLRDSDPDDGQEPDPGAAFPAPADELLEMLEVDNSGADPDEDQGDPGADVEPEPVKLEGSINFDKALDAALFYVHLGFAVLPSCQFNQATGRCTAPASHRHNEDCKGKKPLLSGRKGKDGKPVRGEGYTAATRDRGVIRQWFTKDFPNAGVTIRLDNAKLGCDCILIEGDVKDGKRGAYSYATLADTFDLPPTLTGVSHSGGPHYIFKLPDDLPAGYLGSWTRIGDIADLPDIDLKVGRNGLEHVEPTVGTRGVYRWVDPYAEVAELPRACCDYLHELHERQQQAKLAKSVRGSARYASTSTPGTFDPAEDQTKYLKDAPRGGRRPRLLKVACALAARGATVEQIVEKLKIHDSGFKEAGPTNDYDYMLRAAQGAVAKFGQGVANER